MPAVAEGLDFGWLRADLALLRGVEQASRLSCLGCTVHDLAPCLVTRRAVGLATRIARDAAPVRVARGARGRVYERGAVSLLLPLPTVESSCLPPMVPENNILVLVAA